MIKEPLKRVRELWIVGQGWGSIPKGKSWKEALFPKLGVRLHWERGRGSPLDDPEVPWWPELELVWGSFPGTGEPQLMIGQRGRGASAHWGATAQVVCVGWWWARLGLWSHDRTTRLGAWLRQRHTRPGHTAPMLQVRRVATGTGGRNSVLPQSPSSAPC